MKLPGVRELLGPGRRDESGDVTKGANLSPAQIDTVMGYVMSVAVDWRQHMNLQAVGATDYYTYEKVLGEWDYYVVSTDNGGQAIDELRVMADLLSAANYQTRVKFASDVVRGLEYYTGPVFETELTFDVPNEKGEPVVFGSIGGGGRSDGLGGRFWGGRGPATGVSIGVRRLTAAPESWGGRGERRGGAGGGVVAGDGVTGG